MVTGLKRWGFGFLYFWVISCGVLGTNSAYAKRVAVLINGGGGPHGNSTSFYEDLWIGQNTFQRSSDIFILSADGPGSTLPNAMGKTYDQQGLPEVTRLVPTGNFVGAARIEALEKVLKNHVVPGDEVILYFTDHGGRGEGPQNRNVCLWNETLSAQRLRTLIQEKIPSESRVILISDHCFSGGMLEALRDAITGKVRKNSCGFSAADQNELSYTASTLIHTLYSIVSDRNSGYLQGPVSFRDAFAQYAHKNSTGISLSDLNLKKYLGRTSGGNPERTQIDLPPRLETELKNRSLSLLRELMDMDPGQCELTVPWNESSLQDRELRHKILDVARKRVRVADKKRLDAIERSSRYGRQFYTLFHLWMKEVAPDLWEGASQRAGCLDELFQKAYPVPGPLSAEVQAEFDEKYRKTESIYDRIQVEIDRYHSAISTGSSESLLESFQQFVASSPDPNAEGDESSVNAKNILDKTNRAGDQLYQLGLSSSRCKALYHRVISLEALDQIFERGDSHAAEEYLEIRSCEDALL